MIFARAIAFIVFVLGVIVFVGFLIAVPFVGVATMSLPMSACSLVVSLSSLVMASHTKTEDKGRVAGL